MCVNTDRVFFVVGTLHKQIKVFDLLHLVNARGTFLTSQACLPHLMKASNPHILNLSPPLDMSPRWFAPHCAYTMAKYGMSLCVLGMAEEFKTKGIAVNALWPKTTIATAAVKNILGGDEMIRASRTPAIVADAAHAILCQTASTYTGQFLIDEDVLRNEGVTDFDPYAVEPGVDLMPDLFL
ncbi:MAG: SDR family oxidoreductase [Myxococcota bacterium]|nr:SDR family oxidoreductase [Myxococcota bacterium]